MYGKLRYDYLALLLLALCFSILLTRFYPPFEGMTEWIIMVIIFGSGVYPVYSLRKLQFSQDTPADARLLRMSTVCDKLFRGLGKTILGLLAVLSGLRIARSTRPTKSLATAWWTAVEVPASYE